MGVSLEISAWLFYSKNEMLFLVTTDSLSLSSPLNPILPFVYPLYPHTLYLSSCLILCFPENKVLRNDFNNLTQFHYVFLLPSITTTSFPFPQMTQKYGLILHHLQFQQNLTVLVTTLSDMALSSCHSSR